MNAAPPPNEVSRFLSALHPAESPGWIEVRLIEDRRGGGVVERKWFRTADELVTDLPRLLAVAEARTAAIFYGVLPRRDAGSGKKADILPGLAAWADIDFKDFQGGEVEARARLARFPLKPSIIVSSGHGLHVYLVLREPEDPAVLERLSRALAKAVGGDHTFDSTRLLRLPGTFNRKQPLDPIPVTIEILEPDRAVNPSDIENALNLMGVGTGDEDQAPGNDEPSIKIGDHISDHVQQILASDKKINGLFMGHGKEPVDKRGNAQDLSSSGYDASLLAALIRKGVTDPSELATALHWRPSGEARGKGPSYIERTVRRALAFAAEHGSGGETKADFRVDRIRRFEQTPKRYQLTIAGKTLTVTTPDLLSRGRFAGLYTDHFSRIPTLPSSEHWADWVNGLLERAESVPMPENASEGPAVREAIGDLIDGLQLGESFEDLDAGKKVPIDSGPFAGAEGFKLDTIVNRITEDFPAVKRQDVTVYLRALGFVDTQLTSDKRRRRVWCHPSSESREGERGGES